MDVKQGREVVERYRSLLCLMQYPEEAGPFDREPTPREAMSHIYGMLDRMEEFLNTAERQDFFWISPDWDKFNRWLGFVQGVLWLHGDFTLVQMREHNR
ncbi:hypothetical protein LCGC14_2123730 [marine sediment metagenome]|uniref:Uncharacterized protein n=1 Tax=marine sediment metagenome TaxID=412755 RepID=A0A0F9GGJ1_9ZZZZ